MAEPTGFHEGERLLVRGVNWLGDSVMTQPALKRLREAKPKAHIALLTRHSLAALWENQRVIDEIIPIHRDESIWHVAGKLRGRFDTALVLPNSFRSAIEAYLAGIPERIGHSNGMRDRFLTTAIPPRAETFPMRKKSPKEVERCLVSDTPGARPTAAAHHLHQYLHLVGALDASTDPLEPYLEVPQQALSRVKRSILSLQPSDFGRPWLGLNAGAEYGPAKRWPPERVVDAALRLHSATNCLWLVFGSRNDPVSTAIAEHLRGREDSRIALNLVGETSLPDLAAALKLCRVVLTNDSGPMHLAAAVGTKTVALFGSTSPELTGPGLPGMNTHYLLRQPVPCAPCFLRECPVDFRCMTGITVAQVVESVLQAMSDPAHVDGTL